MSEPYLTPEEVEQTLKAMGESWFSKAEVATLRAYAEVVDALGSREDWPDQGDGKCYFCNAAVWNKPEPKHDEWCAWLRARELRGHADS